MNDDQHSSVLINERYENDRIKQMLLVVDQMRTCRQLLAYGTVPRVRMALILLDNLADVLMYRRCRAIFAVTESRVMYRGRRYNEKTQDRVLRGFGEKIRLVREFDQYAWAFDKHGMISDSDALILQIAHRYRNAAYHRDEHNPTVIGLVVLLLFHAVGRLFIGSHSPRRGMSGPHLDRLLEQLGLENWPDRTHVERHGLLPIREVAARAVDYVLLGLDVPPVEIVRTIFQVDLFDRCQLAMQAIIDIGKDGVSLSRLNELLWHKEFFDAHGRDNQWVASQNRIDDDTLSDSERNRELATANNRLQQMSVSFKPELDSNVPIYVADAASEFRKMRNVEVLFEEYEQCDRLLARFETCLWRAIGDWYYAMED